MSTPISDPDPARPANRVQLLLRWVWLIIGVLLLVIILWAVVFIARESMGGGGGASAADSARSESARRRAAEPLRYDPPDAIRGSAARIVLLRRGSGHAYESRLSSRSAPGGQAVNAVFLEGTGARLLLNTPAYINRVSYPGETAEGDSLRWIVYEMALGDTDKDGQVDESDARSLYVTDLDGRNLRRVLPPGYQLLEWKVQPGGSLVITAVQLTPDGKAMPERAFVLDPSGTVRPYAALDAMVDAAARIVAKP